MAIATDSGRIGRTMAVDHRAIETTAVNVPVFLLWTTERCIDVCGCAQSVN
jgi:hypothetical protein